MLVTIVAVPTADNTGLDADRAEKVEDITDELAVKMLQIGTAREPSAEDLDAYQAKLAAAEQPTADADSGPASTARSTKRAVANTDPQPAA